VEGSGRTSKALHIDQCCVQFRHQYQRGGALFSSGTINIGFITPYKEIDDI